MMDGGPDSAPPVDQDLLSWRVHPARQRPRKAVMVALVVVGLALGSGWYAGTALGIMALFLLTGSLWPFFIPTRYRLTTWGVEQNRWPTCQRRPWSAFRRYQFDRRGVLLSPFPRPSRLDPFRGMYLLTDNEDGRVEQVLMTRLHDDKDLD